MQVELLFCFMNKIKKRSDCPVSTTLDILGDKWSLLIIRDIMFQRKNTYSDFSQSTEKIATNILADGLSMLEGAEILVKDEHPESKAKYFYRLTQKGIDLMPVLIEIILWGDRYNEISQEAKMFAKQLRKNREIIVKQISSGLKKS